MSDKAKVGILILLFFFCLATLFSSRSLESEHGNVRTISPPLDQICRIPKKKSADCLKVASGGDCREVTAKLLRCEYVAHQAYRWINLDCVREIQSMEICEENCSNNGREGKKRCPECEHHRDRLGTCISDILATYFDQTKDDSS
mmetsp:Transcript_15357/g.23789  ORF Transcript_15357/g.23789 Transcript_15357/m.23789 type:complete len:145 (+) Transcript_15357:208-642(+)